MRYRRATLALTLLLGACACPSTPSPVKTNDGAWFVEVEQEGGYWIGPGALRALGVDPAEETPPSLILSQADRQVPCLPLRTEKGWGIFFFTADHATRYTQRTALRLETGLGEVMASIEPPAADSSPGNGLATVRWEKDLRYLPQANADIPWLWEPIYAPGAVTHTVTLPGALPGPITMTLHLWSHTALQGADPDHLLRMTWDGRTLGEWEWDGQGMQRLTASWEEGRPAGEHVLEIETPALPGADVATVWIDGWSVTYPRPVEADNDGDDRGVWQADGAALHVQGAGPGTRMLDVTDPFAPQDLGSVLAGGIVGTTPGHRYWVGRPEEAREPLAIRATRRVDVDALEEVTYLALAPLEFHTALQPLLEFRRNQGLEAEAVDIQAVYDAFGGGQPGPEAIQALVWSLPRLRYLLLVGDGTAEPGGYDGEVGRLRVVTPLARTAVLGETPADGLLGTDEGGRAIVAVGRFPAASVEEVSGMVAKTIDWENGDETPVALVVSDDEYEFEAVTEEIVGLLPEGVPSQSLNAGEETSREDALTALKQGPTWLNYTGHGSLTILGDEGVLTLEDGKSWGKPALVVAWTCLAAHFIHPAQSSIGETWMRTPRGGAVAFLGPVGETTTGEQRPFMRAFYAALSEEKRLGDGWLATLQVGGSQDVAWGYTLLGDPVLRLRWE